MTTWIGRATLHLLLLVPTTLGSRLVLPVLVFLAWAPAAHAWTWPVQGPVLQPFVYDEAHPYASGQHRGIDIGADTTGESVVAPAAGTVEFAGTVPTSGKSVTIETPDGYSVTLTHLGSILVSKGAPVAEGETVGTIGPSGTAEVDGPYVHLGIRVAADPNGYIDRKWIEDEMLWSVKAGILDRVVPVDKLVDDTFVDYALQVLGPYKPAGQ